MPRRRRLPRRQQDRPHCGRTRGIQSVLEGILLETLLRRQGVIPELTTGLMSFHWRRQGHAHGVTASRAEFTTPLQAGRRVWVRGRAQSTSTPMRPLLRALSGLGSSIVEPKAMHGSVETWSEVNDGYSWLATLTLGCAWPKDQNVRPISRAARHRAAWAAQPGRSTSAPEGGQCVARRAGGGSGARGPGTQQGNTRQQFAVDSRNVAARRSAAAAAPLIDMSGPVIFVAAAGAPRK